MNCEWIQKHLIDYADEDLAPDLRRQVEEHIQDCAACREEQDELQALFADCRSVLQHPEPVSDFDSLRARITPPVVPVRKRYLPIGYRVRQGLLAAATVLVVVYVGSQLVDLGQQITAPVTALEQSHFEDTTGSLTGSLLPAGQILAYSQKIQAATSGSFYWMNGHGGRGNQSLHQKFGWGD